MSDGAVLEQSRSTSLGQADLHRVRALAVVGLVVLNLLDLLLTRELLGRGGSESNPLMVMVIGGPWGIAIKLGIPIVVGLRHLRVPLARRTVLALCWMNVLYLGVVSWNFHLMVTRYA